MNKKKFLLPSVFLALTIVAYIVASVLFCYTTKPEVTSGEFPFSITYKYKDEIKTFSGVCKCEFSGSKTIGNEHDRYWDSEVVIENSGNFENDHVIAESEHTTLGIQENMYAGYFMGDPLHKDHYAVYGEDGPTPIVEYYDYQNGIEINEENEDEVLEKIGFEIIDYTYPEPIENSFTFSGVKYEADNVTIFVAISLAFMLLCLIFVRKDKEYKYAAIDKIGICLNFIVGLIAIPFITLICIFFDLNGSGEDILSQIAYNTPAFAIICLTLSIVFRRREFGKPGFFVQFAGVALFALLLLAEYVAFLLI